MRYGADDAGGALSSGACEDITQSETANAADPHGARRGALSVGAGSVCVRLTQSLQHRYLLHLLSMVRSKLVG